MAKNIGILVCLLLVILDVAAGILGIQAEVEQNKVNVNSFVNLTSINC